VNIVSQGSVKGGDGACTIIRFPVQNLDFCVQFLLTSAEMIKCTPFPTVKLFQEGGTKRWKDLFYQGKSRIWGISPGRKTDASPEKKASSGLQCTWNIMSF